MRQPDSKLSHACSLATRCGAFYQHHALQLLKMMKSHDSERDQPNGRHETHAPHVPCTAALQGSARSAPPLPAAFSAVCDCRMAFNMPTRAAIAAAVARTASGDRRKKSSGSRISISDTSSCWPLLVRK